jgi:oxaloacetate decarboxylase gamma subunit
MPIVDLLLAGVNLMVVGMGIVFIFLLTLVFTMKAMSGMAAYIAQRQGGAETLTHPTPGVVVDQGKVRGDLIAVISAAVSQYRATHS